MKSFKLFLLYSVLVCSITNCASQKFEKEVPFSIDEVYVQHWNSGVKMGGSGTNIFVSLKDNLPSSISLDSIYFGTNQLKLIQDSHNPLLFMGRQIDRSKRNDAPISAVVMPKNETKEIVVQPKFQLLKNECVIGFKQLGKVNYFKLETLYTKQTPFIPQAKPNRQ
ncbi:hypothetical protein ACFFVB_02560 [Formosa undariae]|uniref:Uncharacterized protein n=1 Tax=Formosa undariae TaxID=1325436 RepID=A0ABV5EXP0_9FLAO